MPRQARSRALVEAVLESAARVLVERGYAGTNTNLVAERAGVNIGSLCLPAYSPDLNLIEKMGRYSDVGIIRVIPKK
jgi:hypothetical protein